MRLREFVSIVLAALALPAFAESDDIARLAELMSRRDKGGQQGVDLVRRMGANRDLAALDWLIANDPSQIGIYTYAYQEAGRGEPSPEIERRAVENYANPRVGTAILGALTRYSSPKLADKLVSDVGRYSAYWSDRAHRCRMLLLSPRTQSSGAGTLGVVGAARPMPQLDCPGTRMDTPFVLQTYRWSAALRLVGNTDRKDIAARVTPYIAKLSELPAMDAAAKPALMPDSLRARMSELRSIALAVQRERYTPAAKDFLNLLHKSEATTLLEVQAAMPLLKALAAVGTKDTWPEIERWVRLRSLHPGADADPTLYDMISLLSPLDESHREELLALRDTVLGNVEYRDLKGVGSAFRALQALGKTAPAPSY